MNKIINTDLVINYIKKEKLTKRGFCKRCGISENSLRKVLNEQTNVFLSTIFKIIRELNISFSELFRVKDKK